MKTWEMIKKLQENPDKQFISISQGGKFTAKIANPESRVMVVVCSDNIAQGSFDINREWEEVEEPVSWQEAIQAWIDGKSFRVELINSFGDKIALRQDKDKALGLLSGENRCYARNEFKSGKWYIED